VGIACRRCGEGPIERPISTDFDEQTGTVWHVLWFGDMLTCGCCRGSVRGGKGG